MSGFTSSLRPRPLAAGLTALAVIGLAGCSDDTQATDSAPTPTQSSGAAAPSTEPAPSSSSSSSPNSSSSAPSSSAPSSTASSSTANADSLLRAGTAAEKAVDGSRLISIEYEDNQTVWEVQVVTSDGVEHEMDVSVDDAKVTNGPTKDDEDADDRAKHQRRLSDASVDYRDAIEALGDAVPGGTITELDLDTWRGKTVWEADVKDASGAKHEVKVDAGNGSVVSNTGG